MSLWLVGVGGLGGGAGGVLGARATWGASLLCLVCVLLLPFVYPHSTAHARRCGCGESAGSLQTPPSAPVGSARPPAATAAPGSDRVPSGGSGTRPAATPATNRRNHSPEAGNQSSVR